MYVCMYVSYVFIDITASVADTVAKLKETLAVEESTSVQFVTASQRGVWFDPDSRDSVLSIIADEHIDLFPFSC